jgi:hypothetical protein
MEMMATRPGAKACGALGVGDGGTTVEGPEGCDRPHAGATHTVAATSRAAGTTRERTSRDPARKRPGRTAQKR